MPLQFADVGEEQVIRRIGGTPEVKKHLENLGFVVGGSVRVVSSSGGNLIVSLALLAGAVYMLFFRKYKEADKLERNVSVAN